jgi:hypothetical protein
MGIPDYIARVLPSEDQSDGMVRLVCNGMALRVSQLALSIANGSISSFRDFDIISRMPVIRCAIPTVLIALLQSKRHLSQSGSDLSRKRR